MKFTFTLISLLLSVSAFATPVVGDQATYLVNYGGAQYYFSEEVIDVDPSTDTGTVKTTISENGTVLQEQTSTTSLSEMDTPDPALIAQCSTLNGNGVTAVLETIRVKAGTFKACHTTQTVNGGKQDSWVSSVPFGVVKMIEGSGTDLSSMELVSYIKN